MGRTVVPNGEIIRQEREKKAWRQEDLAGYSGCSLKTIQNLERGKHCYRFTLQAVAAKLGVPISQLCEERFKALEPAEKLLLHKVVIKLSIPFEKFDETDQLVAFAELIRRCLGCSIDELVVNDVRIGSTEIVIELTEFYIEALLTLRWEIRNRARRYAVTPPESPRTYRPGYFLTGEEKQDFFNQLRDTVESIVLITIPDDPTIRNRGLIGQYTMPSE